MRFSALIASKSPLFSYQKRGNSQKSDVLFPLISVVEFDASGAARLRDVKSLVFIPFGFNLASRLMAPNYQIHKGI